MCGWDEQTAFQVLLSIISPSLQALVHNQVSVEGVLNTLFQTKYPVAHTAKYYYALENILQSQFITIHKYLNALNFYSLRLSITKGWSQALIDEKKIERFYAGLTDVTILEMARLNISAIDDIIQTISSVEETLIQQTLKNENNFDFEKSEVNNHKLRNNGRKFQHKDFSQNSGFSSRSRNWCWFHKSSSHSSNNCRSIQYQQKNQYKNNENTYENRKGNLDKRNTNYNNHDKNNGYSKTKNFMLTDKLPFIKQINVDAEINKILVPCLIDTGSEKTIISNTLVDKLKLDKNDIPAVELETFVGSAIKTTHSTSFLIKFINYLST